MPLKPLTSHFSLLTAIALTAIALTSGRAAPPATYTPRSIKEMDDARGVTLSLKMVPIYDGTKFTPRQTLFSDITVANGAAAREALGLGINVDVASVSDPKILHTNLLMGGLVIPGMPATLTVYTSADETRINTRTIDADAVLTFSDAIGAWKTVRATLVNSDTAAHTITIPSSFSLAQQETITSFTIPPSGILELSWRNDGTRNILVGDPVDAEVGGSGSVATDSIWTAKGDLAVGLGSSSATRLNVGANDTIPIADSTAGTGIRWGTPASIKTALSLDNVDNTFDSIKVVFGANNLQDPYNSLYLIFGDDNSLRFNNFASVVFQNATAAAFRAGLDLEAGTDFLGYPTGTPTGSKFLRDDNSWQTVSGGTVTSFSAGDLSPLFTTSEATATTTPELTFALSNAAAWSIFGNGTSGSAAPTFEAATGTGSPVRATWATLAGATLTGQLLNSTAGAASAPAKYMTGAWFTGGTGTTTFPHLLLQATGTTASTTWSTAGTGIGVNAVTGFTGNLIDLQLAGASVFKVGPINATLTAASAYYAAPSNGGFRITSGSILTSNSNGVWSMQNTNATGFTRLNLGLASASGPSIGTDAVNGFTLQSAAGTATWNDASTTGSGTVANRYLFGIAAPTLTATNASVTYTKASSFSIGAAPVAGTNVTIGSAYSLDVGGNTNISGTLAVTGASTLTGDVSAGGNVTTTTIGKTLAIKSGTNSKAGTFTCVAGVAVVGNTSVTANSVIVVTLKTVGGTRAGNPDCVPTAATGFTATGGVADTSTYNYVIVEVN